MKHWFKLESIASKMNILDWDKDIYLEMDHCIDRSDYECSNSPMVWKWVKKEEKFLVWWTTYWTFSFYLKTRHQKLTSWIGFFQQKCLSDPPDQTCPGLVPLMHEGGALKHLCRKNLNPRCKFLVSGFEIKAKSPL